MKKIVMSLALVFVAVFVFAKDGNGLLWKVSGNGMAKPAYVFGSHHLAPATFVDQVAGLKDAISAVDAVYGEVAADELAGPKAQQAMMMYAMAPADSTLSKVLTADELARLDNMLASYVGQPGAVAQMDMLKPALVAVQLSMLQTTKAFPDLQVDNAFDVVVMGLGEAAGKQMGSLETIEDQMRLLLGGPISIQAKDLMEAVDNNDKLIQQAADLTGAYLAQDLDEVTRICTSKDYGMEPENLDRLIYSRNRDWVEKIVPVLADKPVLVVVGCGHLGGDQGMLNLLRQKGYTVEPVNK